MLSALKIIFSGMLLLDGIPAPHQTVMLLKNGSSSPLIITQTDVNGHFSLETPMGNDSSYSVLGKIRNDSCILLAHDNILPGDTTIRLNCESASLERVNITINSEKQFPVNFSIHIMADSLAGMSRKMLAASAYTRMNSKEIFFLSIPYYAAEKKYFYLPAGSYYIDGYNSDYDHPTAVDIAHYETWKAEIGKNPLDKFPLRGFRFELKANTNLELFIRPKNQQ
jgi:hypothetical protein